jgi:hypothetical protein
MPVDSSSSSSLESSPTGILQSRCGEFCCIASARTAPNPVSPPRAAAPTRTGPGDALNCAAAAANTPPAAAAYRTSDEGGELSHAAEKRAGMHTRVAFFCCLMNSLTLSASGQHTRQLPPGCGIGMCTERQLTAGEVRWTPNGRKRRVLCHGCRPAGGQGAVGRGRSGPGSWAGVTPWAAPRTDKCFLGCCCRHS